ncbi:MAG: crossover junction endodeoxyribonuclease RuvC [Parcubacteria group bacterium SW_4_46_8]|nr:MAG: crossover junction endodeoxyribonuclease RuvC [Parcubacteria group bacterium SW_4_46_8]
MRVISIDPGYGRCGVAIVEKSGANDETLLYSDCIETSQNNDFHTRLGELGNEIERLVEQYQPDACSIETLYFNSNQKTAMKVAQVRGMIAYIAESAGLNVFEYTPSQIKNAVTGYGKSDKRQVITMLEQLIDISKEIQYDDEYDAIAVGITCAVSETGVQ